MKRFGGNLLLAILSVTLTLGLVEGALRFFNKQRVSQMEAVQFGSQVSHLIRNGFYVYPPSTHSVFINESGKEIAIDVDSEGLRNKEGDLEKAELILLGDSYIFAANTPAKESIAGRLQHSGIKVYNAGMDGYSTFNSVALLRNLLRSSKPRTVILGFYLGNDFHDNYNGPSVNLHINSVESNDAVHAKFFSSIKTSIKESALFRLAYEKFYLLFKKGLIEDPMASYSLAEIATLKNSPDDGVKRSVDMTDLALSELGKMAKENDFELLVMGIPSKAQVKKSFHEISGYGMDPRSKLEALKVIQTGYSFDNPDRILKSLCEKYGFRYLTLLQDFQIHENKLPLYYQIDLHWTPYAQQIVVDLLIHKFLAEKTKI